MLSPKSSVSVAFAASLLFLGVRPAAVAFTHETSPAANVPSTNYRTFIGRRVFCSKPGLKPIWMVGPKYPLQAELEHIKGQVVLVGTVDKNGKITQIQHAQGPSILVKAAEEAVRQWRYSPDSNLPARVTVAFEFTLSDPIQEALRRRAEALGRHRPDGGFEVIYGRSKLYPEEAKRKGMQGLVALRVTVNNKRQITSVKVIRSDNALLTRAAMKLCSSPPASHPDKMNLQERLRYWRYWKPGVTTLVVNFILNPKHWNPGSLLPAVGYLTQAPSGLLIMRSVAADYPPAAVAARIQGEVPVEIKIGPKGDPVAVDALGGPKALRRAALEASRQWRFFPPAKAPVEVAVTYLFELP